MKKRLFLTIYIVFALLLVGLQATEKVAKEKFLTNEEKVTKLFEKWDNPASPGAAVAVIKDGMVVYRNGFGSAHMGNRGEKMKPPKR